MTEVTDPIRVLVCDDQSLVRAGYATIFASQPDLEVVGEAADGRQAVECAERLGPDVVVMDIHMPGMDGIEATRRLAGPDVTAPVRVLAITTFNTDEYVYQALRAGASGFLLKDSTPVELVQGVRTVSTGASLLAPAVTRRLIGRYAARVRPAESTAPHPDPLRVLTSRERQVLTLIAGGLSNAEIAAELFIGHETVKTYVSHILTKLDLRDRVQAVVLAFRVGLVSPEDCP